MADLPSSPTGTISTADNYVLPYDGAGSGVLSIQFRSNSFSGTGIVLKARVNAAAPWLPWPYVKGNVAGSASDGTVATGTAITGNGAIQIPLADGFQFSLDNTAGFVSGSMDYWCRLSAAGH